MDTANGIEIIPNVEQTAIDFTVMNCMAPYLFLQTNAATLETTFQTLDLKTTLDSALSVLGVFDLLKVSNVMIDAY